MLEIIQTSLNTVNRALASTRVNLDSSGVEGEFVSTEENEQGDNEGLEFVFLSEEALAEFVESETGGNDIIE